MQPRDLSDHSPYVPGSGRRRSSGSAGSTRRPHQALLGQNPTGRARRPSTRSATPTASQYPKSSHTDLTAKLAEKWDVSTEQVWVSPGADGSIDYLSRAALEPGDEVLVPDSPTTRCRPVPPRRGLWYAFSPDDGFAGRRTVLRRLRKADRLPHVAAQPLGLGHALDEVRAIADATAEETLVVVGKAY